MDRNTTVESAVPVRRYDYKSERLVVADLGPAVEDVSVELLDDVALVVIDGLDGESQFEIELPAAGVSNTFISNGVLTFEVNEE